MRLVRKATGLCNIGQSKVSAPHKFKRTLDSTSNNKLTWGAAEALLESMMKVRLAQSNIRGQSRDVGPPREVFVD